MIVRFPKDILMEKKKQHSMRTECKQKELQCSLVLFSLLYWSSIYFKLCLTWSHFHIENISITCYMCDSIIIYGFSLKVFLWLKEWIIYFKVFSKSSV